MALDLSTNQVPLPDQAAPSTRAGPDPADAALGEFRSAQGEFEDFFDDAFEQLHSLSMKLLDRRGGPDSTSDRRAEDLKAVADCRRQFRLCLEELHESQAEARDAREETRQVWAEVQAVGQQSLRQFALMRESHAELIEELRRVKSLLTAWLGPDQDRPGANTRGNGSSPPNHDRAVAGEVLAPLAVLRPARSRRNKPP